jgi:transcriptional regulator with XRE-family HTH domain
VTNEQLVDKRLGGRIAHLRDQAGMSQQQLADKLHITQQAVSHIEKGRRSRKVTELGPIARELGVTTVELIDGLGYTDEPIIVTGGAKAGTEGRGKRG